MKKEKKEETKKGKRKKEPYTADDFEEKKSEIPGLPAELQMNEEAENRFDAAAANVSTHTDHAKQLAMQIQKINNMAQPSKLTISELEEKHQGINEHELGLGHFDKEVINFCIDDYETVNMKGTA